MAAQSRSSNLTLSFAGSFLGRSVKHSRTLMQLKSASEEHVNQRLMSLFCHMMSCLSFPACSVDSHSLHDSITCDGLGRKYQ